MSPCAIHFGKQRLNTWQLSGIYKILSKLNFLKAGLKSMFLNIRKGQRAMPPNYENFQ